MNAETIIIIFVVVAVAWSIPWKAWALWRAARDGSKIWFILLFIINTLAILEIIYIFFISKKKEKKHRKK